MVTRGFRRTLDQKFSSVLVNVEHLDPSYKLFVLKIHSAAGLAKKDIFGLSDPYARVRIKSERYDTVMSLSPDTTKTVKRALSPIWNERMCYLIAENQFTVFIDVFDENILTKDDHMGRALLHFDFENKLTDDFMIHPTIWKKDGWNEMYSTRSCLSLMEKYNESIRKELCVLTENENLIYTKGILTEFQDKCRISHQRGVQGVVNISYAFLDPRLPEAVKLMKHDCHINVIGVPACSDTRTRTGSTSALDTTNKTKPSKLVSNKSVPNFGTIEREKETFEISNSSFDQIEEEEKKDILPEGWDMRMDTNGRVVFVNHKTRSTSLRRPSTGQTKPRNYLPRQGSIRETEPESDTTDPGTNDSTLSEDIIDDVIVSEPIKLKKQLEIGLHPDWEIKTHPDNKLYYFNHVTKATSNTRPKQRKSRRTLLITKTESNKTDGYIPIKQIHQLPCGWEARMTDRGTPYYVDHNLRTIHTTKPTEECTCTTISSIEYCRDYQQKYDNLYATLKPSHQIPTVLKLVIHSDHIVEDSYKYIMEIKDTEHLKCLLNIISVTEEGATSQQDMSKWFQLLSSELFNTYCGLFEHAVSDDYTLQVNPDSGNHLNNHLDYFKFIGRVLGMSIYHKILIDAFFICPFYKMLLHHTVNTNDMESVDIELHNTIEYIQENDPEPLQLTFALNKTVFGEVCEEELKPAGRKISVTEDNKDEYINLLIKWRFTQRVHKQMTAIHNGLSDVIPMNLLQIFDAREMEYLLGGLAHIDVNDWRANTELRGYIQTDQVIVWFWKAVENYDDEMRSRLLQFVTGTSKVPMNGFTELQGSNGSFKFCIRKKGQSRDLPKSSTCFNRIDLPPYNSYSELEEKLTTAIEHVL